MNRSPDPLERLFHAAAQAPVAVAEEASARLVARVIASRRQETGEVLPWKTMLRGALICAALIMLLSLAANYRAFQTEAFDELTLADVVIQTSLNP
jgi:hypothetical protein